MLLLYVRCVHDAYVLLFLLAVGGLELRARMPETMRHEMFDRTRVRDDAHVHDAHVCVAHFCVILYFMC